MFRRMQDEMPGGGTRVEGVDNVGKAIYLRKFSADFSKEMSRSVRAMLSAWGGG